MRSRLPEIFLKKVGRPPVSEHKIKEQAATEWLDCSLIKIIGPRKVVKAVKRYTLASGDARRNVDLRDYKDIIVEAVATVMTEKDVTVVVEKDCYYLSPSPSQGEAVKIGRLCK